MNDPEALRAMEQERSRLRDEINSRGQTDESDMDII